MKKATRKIIELALESDSECSQFERETIMLALDGKTVASDDPNALDSVMTRKEVAHAFHKTTKWVDWECKRPGTLLRRVYLGGTRSSGYSRASVRAALEAATSPEAQELATSAARDARAKAVATIKATATRGR